MRDLGLVAGAFFLGFVACELCVILSPPRELPDAYSLTLHLPPNVVTHISAPGMPCASGDTAK